MALMAISAYRSWASALRLSPPASAFLHSVSQSGTGDFPGPDWAHYSGTGLVPASTFVFILVPD
jgi:hypothetical protein